jgi:protein-tyrosine phosphatase
MGGTTPVHLGLDVHLGGFRCCDPAKFERIVHIYRQGNIPHHTCQSVCRNSGHGLRVLWGEGEPLGLMNPCFDTFVAYVRPESRLLVHCTAGVCRSAQLALAALLARGMRPGDAIKRLYEACWGDPEDPRVPELYNYNLAEMFTRLERHYAKRT